MHHLKLTFTGALLLALAVPVLAATFHVDSVDDAVDLAPGDGLCMAVGRICTLRAAVLEANALAGIDTIILPAGRYELRFPGVNEERAFKGDLDILDDVIIHGAGEDSTIISGQRK